MTDTTSHGINHHWEPGDTPETHPMWETQVDLEYGMLRRGADKYRDQVLTQQDKGHMHRITPLRRAMIEWLPGCVDVLRQWLADCRRTTGPVPISAPVLDGIDHYMACLIAIRTVLDRFGTEQRGLATLAINIGATVEYEERMRYWAKAQPGLFRHIQRDHKERKSTAQHIRTVNLHKFNLLAKEGTVDDKGNAVTWEPWTKELQFRVGIQLLDTLIKFTGWFEVQSDPAYRRRRGVRIKPPLVLAVKEGMAKWLDGALDAEELRHPEFRPTVMPPKRWDGTRNGGYWTPYVRPPRLVRFKAHQEHQRHRAADEYDAFDMPKVYQALNVLQETPWKVNGPVLDVAIEAWSKGLTTAEGKPFGDLPEVDDKELPPRTARMELDTQRKAEAKERNPDAPPPPTDEATEKDIIQWKRAAARVYDFNARRHSRARAATATIHTAQDFRKFDRIYFPHMLDWRGRYYPIPSFLQPQGNDLARGLLTFAEGMAITEENAGAGWLAIQLASCLGIDKVSFDDRIAYVEERNDLWRAIAADPLAKDHRDVWGASDKPWQALAAIFEWVGFLDTGWGYVSHLPVMVDGTCNGIQHLSAMTRDEEAAFHVNLLPSDKPQDIYKHVAKGLQATLERIQTAGGEQGAHADYWLTLCGEDLPRGLTKRQVMVLPYGGTRQSFFDYTREWLDGADPVPVGGQSDADRELRNKRVAFLSLHLWDVVGETVVGGVAVMKWLQDCAKVVCREAQPIYWVTPAGFVVRHFYGTEKSTCVDIKLDGQRYQVRRVEFTDKLNVEEQIRGIAPNFIHSLDASCLSDCIVLALGKGITSFASIHDAYGTHAAHMWTLAGALRTAFVDTHTGDNLGQFRWACQRVLVDAYVAGGMDQLDAVAKADLELPPPLPLGQLDLAKVLESDYFFA